MEKTAELYKGPLKVEVETSVRYDMMTGEKTETQYIFVKRADNNHSVTCFAGYQGDNGQALHYANLLAAALIKALNEAPHGK